MGLSVQDCPHFFFTTKLSFICINMSFRGELVLFAILTMCKVNMTGY